ncbi:MAG TPA: aminotransferase class III-fold pyridoxal phosphate-dependent enzyme, partial [Dehalococcoidia bacterium]|nr:aminotransferase class III-fold pyridoxal phosphate-dependent enzyme [Dehalococcoidia bacterium]
LARKWGKVKRDGAYEVIVADGAFHGRTLGALAATAMEKYRLPFTPLPEGFVRVPFNDLDAIKQATGPQTAAVLVEPIQGEGGVIVPDDDYLPGLRAWCDQAGILLIFDEVQTGMGRCGALFAHQLYGVKPDVMTLAKGLGGGFPVGAFVAQESASVFEPSEHASTFGGNPLACHVGHTVLKYMLDNDIPGQVARKGDFLRQRLYAMADRRPFIEEVRGRGLLWALQLKREAAEEGVHLALKEGLLINNVRPNALRLMPPLTVSEAELEQCLAILEPVIERLEKDGA